MPRPGAIHAPPEGGLRGGRNRSRPKGHEGEAGSRPAPPFAHARRPTTPRHPRLGGGVPQHLRQPSAAGPHPLSGRHKPRARVSEGPGSPFSLLSSLILGRCTHRADHTGPACSASGLPCLARILPPLQESGLWVSLCPPLPGPRTCHVCLLWTGRSASPRDFCIGRSSTAAANPTLCWTVALVTRSSTVVAAPRCEEPGRLGRPAEVGPHSPEEV